nr:sulfotransferase [Ruegeria arenilitoris]
MREKLHNIRTQILSPQTKIFFIGYNKCGTTSLDHLLKSAAIRSVHYHAPMVDFNPLLLRKPLQKIYFSLASEVVRRSSDRAALRKLLDRHTAYSDLFFFSETSQVEAIEYFELFHDLYPEAFFILNDRDENKWLQSRKKHKGGSLVREAMKYYATDTDGVIEIWRSKRKAHVENALRFFEGNLRFLHFRIDQDDIKNLVEFLAPEFKISDRDWIIMNKTIELN